MAVRKAQAVAQVGRFVEGELEPGEHVLGVVLGQVLPRAYWWLVGLAGVTAVTAGGLLRAPGSYLLIVLVVVTVTSTRRPLFVAVTTRRLLLIRASRLTGRPEGLIAAPPAGEVRAGGFRPGLFTRLKLASPRAGEMTMWVPVNWRAEAGAVRDLLSHQPPPVPPPPVPPPPA